MPGAESIDLRRRAAELRRVATRIDAAPALDLPAWSGPDTWSGRRVAEAEAHYDLARRTVLGHATLLRDQARAFECRADELDVMASSGPSAVGSSTSGSPMPGVGTAW